MVISFDPRLSIKFIDELVIPPDSVGGSLDLINYFPYKAFVLMVDNGTQILNPISLLMVRKDLKYMQSQIQAKEFSNILSRVKILVINSGDFWEKFFPNYNSTFKVIIEELSLIHI